MPIYEYECKKCGEVFEVLQRHSDPPPRSHSCGSRRVQRVMSQTSFQLKGDGWYATDYGSKSATTSEKKDGGAAVEKSEKSEKKSTETAPKASAA
ncbi:MAG: zinc ribbon domain-containing protein [Myxococcota bacterium]